MSTFFLEKRYLNLYISWPDFHSIEYESFPRSPCSAPASSLAAHFCSQSPHSGRSAGCPPPLPFRQSAGCWPQADQSDDFQRSLGVRLTCWRPFPDGPTADWRKAGRVRIGRAWRSAEPDPWLLPLGCAVRTYAHLSTGAKLHYCACAVLQRWGFVTLLKKKDYCIAANDVVYSLV